MVNVTPLCLRVLDVQFYDYDDVTRDSGPYLRACVQLPCWRNRAAAKTGLFIPEGLALASSGQNVQEFLFEPGHLTLESRDWNHMVNEVYLCFMQGWPKAH